MPVAAQKSVRLRGERDYLYRRIVRVDKALGVRSPTTEAALAAFVAGKSALEQRANGLRQTWDGMDPVNRAMGLGRVPKIVARILKVLDKAGGPRSSKAAQSSHPRWAVHSEQD